MLHVLIDCYWNLLKWIRWYWINSFFQLWCGPCSFTKICLTGNYTFAFVWQCFVFVWPYLVHADHIWYMLTIFGAILYENHATAFALGLPFPQDNGTILHDWVKPRALPLLQEYDWQLRETYTALNLPMAKIWIDDKDPNPSFDKIVRHAVRHFIQFYNLLYYFITCYIQTCIQNVYNIYIYIYIYTK